MPPTPSQSRRRRFRVASGLWAAAWLCAWPPVAPGDARADEVDQTARLKAAFVLNFARFATWENRDVGANIELCVDEGAAFRNVAQKEIDGQDVGDRKLVVKPVAPGGRYDEICDVVFLEAAEIATADIGLIEAYGAFTVSDADGFVESGGAVGMVSVAKKLRFEVNLKALERSRVALSSKLLRLAVRVIR